jgi:hypothetical protein
MSHPLVLILSIVLCLWLEPGLVKAAEEAPAGKLTRFDAVPGSKIMVESQGSIHNWKAEATLISGFVELAPGFLDTAEESTTGPRPARAEVFIPVHNLKGVGENWEPYNEPRTGTMHKRLRADDYPKILFRLKELVRTAASRSTGVPYEFEATGELAIAGVTNRISMPIRVVPLPGARLKISGMAKIKQSDFNIIPKPKIVFEYMDRDTVNIVFEWMVAQKGGT